MMTSSSWQPRFTTAGYTHVPKPWSYNHEPRTSIKIWAGPVPLSGLYKIWIIFFSAAIRSLKILAPTYTINQTKKILPRLILPCNNFQLIDTRAHNVSQRCCSVNSNHTEVSCVPSCLPWQNKPRHNRTIWIEAYLLLINYDPILTQVHMDQRGAGSQPNCFTTSGSETRPRATTSI